MLLYIYVNIIVHLRQYYYTSTSKFYEIYVKYLWNLRENDFVSTWNLFYLYVEFVYLYVEFVLSLRDIFNSGEKYYY